MKSNRKRQQAGFSLVELLVVVAIIFVLLAIAIPSYLSAMRSSRGSAAASTVDGYAKAAATYQNEWATIPLTAGAMGGAENFGATATCAAGGQIPTADATSLAATMTRGGYLVDYVASGTQTGNGGCAGATNYDVTARPQVVGVSGTNAYCADPTGRYYIAGAGIKATGAGCKTDGFTIAMGQ